MRLLINCPSGQSRLLQVAGDATVLELKELLQDEEGIPVRQQVLCFAGLHMKDHLTLLDHKLEELTLSDEVVIYLTHKLADPKLIYLAARAQPSQLSSDLVEADMPGALHSLEMPVSRGRAGRHGWLAGWRWGLDPSLASPSS
ncbi:polyubiquitin, partial [Haematococcus lacustris]